MLLMLQGSWEARGEQSEMKSWKTISELQSFLLFQPYKLSSKSCFFFCKPTRIATIPSLEPLAAIPPSTFVRAPSNQSHLLTTAPQFSWQDFGSGSAIASFRKVGLATMPCGLPMEWLIRYVTSWSVVWIRDSFVVCFDFAKLCKHGHWGFFAASVVAQCFVRTQLWLANHSLWRSVNTALVEYICSHWPAFYWVFFISFLYLYFYRALSSIKSSWEVFFFPPLPWLSGQLLLTGSIFDFLYTVYP